MGCVGPLQWQELLLGNRHTMRALGMLARMGTPQQLGYGGLPGQRTARTGSVWPPYPGANQGYWARQAGFYNTRTHPTFSPTFSPTSSIIRTTSAPIRPGSTQTLPTLFRPYQVLLSRQQVP